MVLVCLARQSTRAAARRTHGENQCRGRGRESDGGIRGSCGAQDHGTKKKGSGTGSRGLALSYPGLPAPLDVNRSVSVSSLDVGCAWAQKQMELRRSTARLEYLVRAADRRDGMSHRTARLFIGGAREDRGCTRDKSGGHVGSDSASGKFTRCELRHPGQAQRIGGAADPPIEAVMCGKARCSGLAQSQNRRRATATRRCSTACLAGSCADLATFAERHTTRSWGESCSATGADADAIAGAASVPA